MKALAEAIWTLFSAVPANTFYTGVGGRLYFHEAAQDADLPYGVYSIVSQVPGHTFGDSGRTEIFRVQFSVVAEGTSAAGVMAINEYLKSLMDDCVLTVSGYTFLGCMREDSHMLRFSDGNKWMHTTDYLITLEA